MATRGAGDSRLKIQAPKTNGANQSLSVQTQKSQEKDPLAQPGRTVSAFQTNQSFQDPLTVSAAIKKLYPWWGRGWAGMDPFPKEGTE